jgi:hypothetical protein
MQPAVSLDRAGRRRSPATTSIFHLGVPPHNKGVSYPPDPPTVEEIVAAMSAAGDSPDGIRLRAVIIILWRAGLRISEALSLNETDLDPDRGSLLVRHGKGDKRREVGMDRWAWTQLEPWLQLRRELPVGRLICVLRGPTQGRACAPAGIRAQLHHVAAVAGVRRRFAPHQLRHAHAVEMSREGISLIVIQRQLGHADLAITSRYLRGIDNTDRHRNHRSHPHRTVVKASLRTRPSQAPLFAARANALGTGSRTGLSNHATGASVLSGTQPSGPSPARYHDHPLALSSRRISSLSSQTRKIIERLYAYSSEVNAAGQWSTTAR